MIKKYSFEVFKPEWPKWKTSIADFFLNSFTYLGVARANGLIRRFGKDQKNHAFIDSVINDVGHVLDIHHLDNLPTEGPVTLVANHPGGADVVATISTLGKVRPDFVILANELICVEPVVDIVLPVSTMSKSNKVDMSLVDQAYKDGKVVVFYAAGKNSRYNEAGELRDRKWRTTFLDYALKYKTPISVLKIGGSNAKIFYKVSKFREKNPRFKKIPLENIFQLRELVKAKKEPITLKFSKPISSSFISEKLNEADVKDKRDFADELYNFLYEMEDRNFEF